MKFDKENFAKKFQEKVEESKDTISVGMKNAAKKTGDLSKKLVSSAKSTAENLSEQKQIKDYAYRMKKYNPLFPDDYTAESFKLPNFIIIVDDAVRKGIDVCEGAMGWLSNQKGVEVLHLYDEDIKFSGLNFLPAPMCDCAYYVDPHNRKTFISIDSFFGRMQEEKLAELQHIAYSLGAKSYRVEITESSSKKEYAKQSASAGSKGKAKLGAGAERENNSAFAAKNISLATATFTDICSPQKPKLCWFEHDRNVQNLIEMRCSGNELSNIKEYTIELSNSNSATMSQNMAGKIEVAAKDMGVKCDFNSKSEEEHNRKMIFKLEF